MSSSTSSVSSSKSKKQRMFSSGRGGAGNMKKHSVTSLVASALDDTLSIHSGGLSHYSSNPPIPNLPPSVPTSIAARRHFNTNEDSAFSTNGLELDPRKMHSLGTPKVSGRTGRGGAGYFKYLMGNDGPYADAELYPQTAALMAEHEQRVAQMEREIIQRSRERRNNIRNTGRGGVGNISLPGSEEAVRRKQGKNFKAKTAVWKGKGPAVVNIDDDWHDLDNLDKKMNPDVIRMQEFGVRDRPRLERGSRTASSSSSFTGPSVFSSKSQTEPCMLRKSQIRISHLQDLSHQPADTPSTSRVSTTRSHQRSALTPQHHDRRNSIVLRRVIVSSSSTLPSPISSHTPPQSPLPLPPSTSPPGARTPHMMARSIPEHAMTTNPTGFVQLTISPKLKPRKRISRMKSLILKLRRPNVSGIQAQRSSSPSLHQAQLD